VQGWCTDGLVGIWIPNYLYILPTYPIRILTYMFYDVSYIYLCVPPESICLNSRSTVNRTTQADARSTRLKMSISNLT